MRSIAVPQLTVSHGRVEGRSQKCHPSAPFAFLEYMSLECTSLESTMERLSNRNDECEFFGE